MLTPRQKAAVIVRLLNAEGMTLPLQELSDEQQTLLTGQIAQMRPIDRDTLNEIIEEFCTQLESIGLTFPKGLDGALTLLDGQLSTTAASRLRRMISNSANSDPWQRIAGLAPEVLEPAILEESPEVAAVILSKLPVPTAAEILGKLPGEKARRIAYAVSLTGNVAPEVVQRIGMVLAQQLDVVAAKAFTSGPVERVGAILNQSPSRVRDSVIEGLEEEDRQFAEQVRKAIFTFALIPQRIEARDVPKILRGLDQKVILTALASATGPDAAAVEFIFANISQRLAATLREEMEQLGKIRESEGEAARAQVVAAARDLEAAGELAFVAPEEE
ncbi:flagellar motor switch protein FliG [Paenirhodobacter populi]|uniref:Flagellar motor switch protein FliG n=1 Tax=Paenirhodobacter populi TaxID=2306993 RepID=A0A443KA91_9RHOB|nr:FliG C-terminal domain-containing protein [Sinirhodobacter populi]RWR12945.1 flagellar motor switch protein FliG [Sinirhodobacter populi]RWR29688.1 flagellar motor switch protein FliG [Sinirhodobacter populi]